MGWKDKKTGMFPGKELRIKGGKEQKSRGPTEDLDLKGSCNRWEGSSPATEKREL